MKEKEPLAFRELAAYAALLKRARDSKLADLAANASRDLGIRELWDHPDDHRSDLVELRGFVRGIVSRESKLVASGKLYELWIAPPGREREVFACVAEKLPQGFQVDASDGEPVVFHGFFLKVIVYEAVDSRRGAPLLIGRFERAPGENRADPLRAGERGHLPKEAGTAISVPTGDDRFCFTVSRNGSLNFENKPIALTDLAFTLTRLAAQIRRSALVSRTPLDPKRGLPGVVSIQADGEIRCANILRILNESGKRGFGRFALKSPDTEAPADRKAVSKASSAARHKENNNDPPAGLRTIPISIAADDRGRIACAEIGEVQYAALSTLRLWSSRQCYVIPTYRSIAYPFASIRDWYSPS